MHLGAAPLIPSEAADTLEAMMFSPLRKQWHSIDRKLPLLASGLVLLTAGVLALTAYDRLHQALVDTARKRLATHARIATQLIVRPGFRRDTLPTAIPTRPLVDFILGRGSAAEVMSALSRPQVTGENKTYAALLDSIGRPLVVFHRDSFPTPSWPFAAIRAGRIGGDSVVISPLEAYGATAGYSRVKALRLAPGSAVIGYVVATYPFTSSTAQAFREMVGQGVQMLVGQPGEGVWTDLTRVTAQPSLLPSEDSTLMSGDTITASARIPGTNLLVWLSQPSHGVLGPMRPLLWELLPLGLLIAILGAAIMWRMARRITHPLAQLTDVAEGVARDSHSMPNTDEIPIPIRDGDEITRLRYAFERMSDRVAERQALEQQLRQSQKMEAVGRLAGGVAHDFNNLLTAIRSYADLMLDDMTPYDSKRGDVMEIRKAAERAAGLTAQLLAFSRKSMLQPRVLDVSEVLTDVHGMLKRLMIEDITLEVFTAPGLWAVKVDRGQLEQVIVNLAVNARDAMPNGGTLRISALNDVLVDPIDSRHGPVPPGEYVAIRVTDTGLGMDTTTQNQVFEPFFTTKAVGQGTGLGLSTVHGIVAQSGGHVTLESQPSRGSTFTVYLPRVRDEIPKRNSGGASATPKGNNETILLVEDEPSVRSLARRVLVRAGFRVLEAASPTDALRLAEQHSREIKLVLSDVVMPEMSGPALVLELEEMCPGCRVLFISGYTDDEVIGRGLGSENMDLLQKPFSAQQLVERVREAIARVPEPRTG